MPAALIARISLAALLALAPAAWPQADRGTEGSASPRPDSPPPPAVSPAPQSPWLWRAATGGQIRSRPAIGPDGSVYALSEDSYLYAWTSGGSLRWKHDLGWIPWDCLAVSDDGTVYAGLKNGDFLAVNPRGGRLWTVRLDGLPAGDPAIAADGTVLVGTTAGSLFALSHLGRREWSLTLPGAVIGQPAVDGDGTIYLCAADRRVYSLAPWGEFSWSLPVPGTPGPPVIAADGSVLVGTDAGQVLDVTPAGDVRWKASVGAAVSGLAVSAGGVIAGSADGRVTGYAPDGRELWRAPGRPPLSSPMIAGLQVLVAAQDGSVQRFDAASGMAMAPRPGAAGSPVMAPDGSILVGGRDWVIYAMGAVLAQDPGRAGGSTGAAVSPWPQAGHDALHSGRSPVRPPAGAGSRLEENPDYLYLQGLLGTGGRDGVQLVLSELAGRLSSGTLGKSRWYAARLLEYIVGFGLVTQVRQNQKLVNDFPDLRAQAAALLGRVGSASSRIALLRAAAAERDPVALAAEVRAVGAISSDGDGASLRAVVRAFTARASLGPDDRLADAMVDAVGHIAAYEGGISERSAVDALISVTTGPYDPSTQSAAMAILQGDLKAYILDHEE